MKGKPPQESGSIGGQARGGLSDEVLVEELKQALAARLDEPAEQRIERLAEEGFQEALGAGGSAVGKNKDQRSQDPSDHWLADQ